MDIEDRLRKKIRETIKSVIKESETSDRYFNAIGRLPSNPSKVYDRMDSLANVSDLKNFQRLLISLSNSWLEEGFEIDDIVSYVSNFIENNNQISDY